MIKPVPIPPPGFDDLALDEKIELLEAMVQEAKVRARPSSQLSASAWVAALRQALVKTTTPAARRRVVQSLVKEIKVCEEDVVITMKTNAAEGIIPGSGKDQEWLPGLDSNQQPSG